MHEKRIETKSIQILKDLIRINTSNEDATEYQAAFYIKDLLKKECIETEILYSPNGRANLIAKLEGIHSNKEPLVLLSHLDVVSPGEGNWTNPPFSGKEEAGYIWGRGTLDTKQLTAMHIMAFLELKKANISLNRDVYLVASADEENGSQEGMAFLSVERPEIFMNATVLSEGGGFTIPMADGNDHMLYASGEKGTAIVKIVGLGDSGHAGSPPEYQAIFNISAAMQKLLKQEQTFTVYPILDTYTKAFQNELNQEMTKNQLQQKLYEYMKFPTVTVDYLRIGEQINVIPYTGEALLEFRTLPYQTRDDFTSYMNDALNGFQAAWDLVSFQEGYESEVDSEIIELFRKHSPNFGFTGSWVPFTALGKTDGRFISRLAKNIYGLSPVNIPFQDVLSRVHNVDERIEVDSFLYGMNVMRKAVNDYCLLSMEV